MADVGAPDVPAERLIRPGMSLGPKPPSSGIPQVSCSAIGAFAVCPQLHGFGYEMGLRHVEDKDALVIGTLIHVGLAYRYGMRMNPRPEWMVYPTPQAPDPRVAIWTIGADRLDCASEALRIFDHYQAHYTVPTWNPILVEQKLEAVFEIDGIKERYTLRLDLLAQDMQTGEIVLPDHKSAYRLGKWVGHDYRLDREMMTALWLARLCGYRVDRVVINAMSKGTKGDPQPKFQRYDVPISQSGFDRIDRETIYWIRQMRAVRAAYPDPKNRPRTFENCMRKYGRCDFYPVCADGDQNLSSYVRKWK